MVGELSAVLRRPLQPLAWHQQRTRHGAVITCRSATEPRRDLSDPIGREQYGPAERNHKAS